MERFVVLPFSIGCTSQSSIDVIGNPSSAKKSKHEAYPSSITRVQGEGGGDNSSGVKVKNSLTRLIKSIKTISQLFVYREDEEEEEEEIEIEIGFPTDVIHVTHIGWDGSTTTTNTNNNNATTTNLFSSQTNSLSLNQFEFAMARPRHADHVGSSRAPSLIFGPSTNNPKSTSS